MEILADETVVQDLLKLLDYLDKSQWTHVPSFELIKGIPVITRAELRNKPMKKGIARTTTSGSTGEPVTVEKTYSDYIWHLATNIREIRWRKWDVTKTLASIAPTNKLGEFSSWGIPKAIEAEQGPSYTIGLEPISVLQKWLEEISPHYIHTRPSILNALDLTKLSNLTDTKGTGELGGTMYSSEEFGTIAIQCPDNPSVMHVMENLIVETDKDGGAIITSLTNPYTKRYKLGDHVTLGECTCGRTLQTITSIKGRVRNMFVMPNGDKKWPLIGSLVYYEQFGIKQYKAVQTSLYNLDLYIICSPLGEREEELKKTVQEWLGVKINVAIKYVEAFDSYKFEEFISFIE